MILGVEWIEKCIEGYQIYVVTHIDKDHLHNHFVINSVSLENGLKLQISPQKLLKMKQLSNEICKRENLATINLESDTGISKCHNEYSLEKRCKKQDKNFKSLKSLIREKINHAINSSNDFDNFKKFLFDKYNINTIENNSAIVFNDESINMKVSGRKLGGSFTKKSIKNRINNKLELKTD